jgi:EmrB/QacA subfamily drug resistance transporter
MEPLLMTADRTPSRWIVLAVLCLSLLAVVIDGTIVNTALPTFARELDASSSDLQWIVDAYTLAFAGLLLVAGAAGDRYGRHHALSAGLVVFGAASGLAALSGSAAELIGARALMGVGAAFVMPATLSILSDVFRSDPVGRAKAIGIWSGVSGLGVAIGPSAGGLLLAHLSWGSIFLVNLPVVVLALALGRRFVPASRAQQARGLDPGGAVLSIAGLGAVTYAVIQGPVNGWSSAATLVPAIGGLALLAGFAAWERRHPEPMLDVRLFSNLRFTAASLSVTAVFFTLFGALFLLTQILQLVLGWSTVKAGFGAMPFAVTVGVTSPLAAELAKRIGTKIPVVAGLLLMAAGLAHMGTASTASGYGHFVVATVLMAAGMGLAMAPSTESIMGALPPEQAGVGSAVNDTTREIGGVLGVAILGSIANSAYVANLGDAAARLPHPAAETASSSLAGALAVAHQAPAAVGHPLALAAQDAFVRAADKGVLVAAIVAVAGAVFAARALPARAVAYIPAAAAA